MSAYIFISRRLAKVSGDFVRNILNAVVGTVNTIIGTPSESSNELKKGSPGSSHQTSGNGKRSRHSSQRRRKESIEALRDSSSLGKRIQAELLEIRMAQRKLLAASQTARKTEMSNKGNLTKQRTNKIASI